MDTEAEILRLRSRITAAQRARVRAEHERDAAQAAEQHARSQLAEKFGVTTREEARAVHAQLSADLHQALAELEAKLDAAGV